ncbi:MAG: gliding motility-associated C-terminal domain-containing protein [Bacteroidetes bacterium]|nr:gliding motility-associated C-terminal domain-containing protein [Bacteroidota bacterium]
MKKISSLSFSVFITFCLLPSAFCLAQGVWTQKTNFPGTKRPDAVGFAIGSKGYLGMGVDNIGNFKNDLWEYDPSANSWAQKANLPALGRQGAAAFSIGNKGYVGIGVNNGNNYVPDFWEYDPSTNSWVQKANFPGAARSMPVSFSIGNIGYVGTGYDGTTFMKDFWAYDPASNSWTQKANFGGSARVTAVGFSIGNFGYLGTGSATSGYLKDFWQYDPASNSWTAKANFPGLARSEATGLAIGNLGYIGTGFNGNTYFNDFYSYNPATNSWTAIPNFIGTARIGIEHSAFAINCHGYFGTGLDKLGNYFNDFYEYFDPSNNPCGVVTIAATSTNVSCFNSCNGTASSTPTGGSSPYTFQWLPSGQTTQNISNLCAGNYSVVVFDANGNSDTTSVSITQPSQLISTINSTDATCGNNNGTAAVAAAGGSPSYTYLWNNGQTSSAISNLSGGNYSVTITDANGCSTSQTVAVNSTSAVTVQASGDTTITVGGNAVLSGNGSSGSYVWSNGQSGNIINVSPLVTTVYCVAVSDSGCTDTACVTVKVEPIDCSASIYLPNAFSPNEDGENDLFYLYGKKECVESLHIRIYNRWGEKIFESSDKNFQWDGEFRGTTMNTAVLTFYCDINLTSGTKIHKQGNVSLVR